jgi:adenylyltransferase/sulfurtransferase
MDFSRQIILPQLGVSGQKKLKESKILVVGAGGLGCAVLPYLAAAGVGTLGIIDGDRVAASNLHRQLLYSENQIGLLKSLEAKKYLNAHFPEVVVSAFDCFLEASNARNQLQNFDLIIDATDEISARYLLNDFCQELGIPWVYGSIHQFQGQVSVFNFENGPNYKDLFPVADTDAISCSDAGVLGTTVGMIGMLQANEAIKIVGGFGKVLSGKVLIYDLLSCSQQIFEFENRAENTSRLEQIHFPFISIEEVIQSKRTVLDVREKDEKPEIIKENFLQTPLSILAEKVKLFDRAEEICIFCQTGKRSQTAAEILNQLGFTQIRLIKGGAKEILEQLSHEIEQG